MPPRVLALWGQNPAGAISILFVLCIPKNGIYNRGSILLLQCMHRPRESKYAILLALIVKTGDPCVTQYTFRCVIQHTLKCFKYMPLVCNNTPSDVLSSTPCRTHPYK